MIFFSYKKRAAVTFFAMLLHISMLNAFDIDLGRAKLEEIHESLKLRHGSFLQEYPEQLMAATFIAPDAKVLELGGNVGRNSCVIAYLLEDQANLVVMEPSPGSARQLQENRDLNNLSFQIEIAAVSRVPLVLSGWDSKPSEIDIPGWTRINTITFQEVEEKFGISFDTLVADCEGALYYILKDDETILDNLQMIIVENDYRNLNHYLYTKQKFEEKGFSLVYNQSGGWGPCRDCFFQVWVK
jgi:FkbM family methyltransferase